jgi:hypothetical protein
MDLFLKKINYFFSIDKECDQKETEYSKACSVARGEFQTLCKQLGIQGVHIRRELVDLVTELPSIYSKLAQSVKTLNQAVEFYTEFVKFIFGKEHPGGCVPLLKYMIGNFIF